MLPWEVSSTHRGCCPEGSHFSNPFFNRLPGLGKIKQIARKTAGFDQTFLHNEFVHGIFRNMPRYGKRAAIGGLGTLLAALFYLLQAGNQMETTERAAGAASEAGTQAEVQVGPFSFVQTRDGAPAWTLTAREGRIFEKSQRADMKEVAATLRSARGWTLTLESDAGRFDMATKNFSLTSDETVQVQSNDGYTMQVASPLTWSDDSRTIAATGPVRLNGTRFEVNGQALSVRVDTQEVTVSGHVQARVY
jgi:LPS export ABC transporter protein LptC